MLICLLGFTYEARAQSLVNFDRTRWSAFVEFDGSFDDRENTKKSRDTEFEESLKVIQRGNILDRRIANFSLEVQPIFSQGFRDGPGAQEDTTGLDLNYAGHLNVLEGTTIPFSFNAFAARSTGDTTGDLGSRSEFQTQEWLANVRWKSAAFPTTLTYRERSRDQTFRSGLTGATSKRDDVLRRVTFKAHSNKLDIELERDMFDDRVTGRNSDFDSNRARLHHRLRWGKGSHLDTRANYFDRTGRLDTKRANFEERASIKHSEALSSVTSYRFSATEQETRTLVHNGQFDLTHRLYSNLTTGFSLSADLEDSEEVNRNGYGTNLSLAYTKGIPWGGRLSLNAGGGFRYTDRDSAGGFLNIIDESQLVPAALTLLLNRRFVAPSSVVVTEENGPAIFTEGIDYDVRAAGGNFTEIRIIPGGGISAGDSIAVSYSYENLPSASYYGVPYQVGAEVDFGWISVFLRTSGREEGLISGEDESVLTTRRTSVTGTRLRWSGQATSASFTAQASSSEIDGFETLSYSFAQSVSHAFTPKTSMNASASQSFTETDERDTRLYSLNLALHWRALPNLTVRPRLTGWQREERGDLDRTERFIRGGLDLDIHWRKLTFDLRYDHILRAGDVIESSEDRVVARLTRGF